MKLADVMHDRLERQIADFQASLGADQETAVCLANFGRDITIVIEHLGYHNPELVVFSGIDESGNSVRLLQHVSQVNLLLKAVPVEPGKLARRIGFTGSSK